MTNQGRKVSKGGISKVWLVPLVALLLGGWMVVYTLMNEGPTIDISFENADGLTAGKTKLKYLSVEIGHVESVFLNPKATGVIVRAKLEKEHEHLLKKDTRFWVEKARIGAGGVSGLSTILSGAYIKLAPGKTPSATQLTFTGLEEPPVTDVGAPGTRLVIESDSASSVSVGDSVLYNDYVVGRVETMSFDQTRKKISYSIFVDAPFHELLNTSVRFWNSSGVSLTATAEGVSINTGSLDSIISGGIAFGVPEGLPLGEPVNDGDVFTLFSSYSETLERPYIHGQHYVVSFRQNIAGLVAGAPVQYRGITIGRVERILIKEMVSKGMRGRGGAIPVLVYLEPGRLEVGDSKQALAHLHNAIETGVSNGLRATLATGNLLTGSLLVNLDYYPDEPEMTLTQFNGFDEIPSISGGLEQIQHSVAQLLNKLNALPLEQTVSTTNGAIAKLDQSLTSLDKLLSSEATQDIPVQLNAAATSVNRVLSSEDTQNLPVKLNAALDSLKKTLDGLAPDSPVYEELDSTLYELHETLQSLEELTKSLSDATSILPSADSQDPEPQAQ